MVLSSPLDKALATNSTASSFASLVPTATEPTADGVKDIGISAGVCPDRVVILPFAIGDDDSGFGLRLWGWRFAGYGSVGLWVPELLIELNCTLTNLSPPGVSGKIVNDTERFAGSISVANGDVGHNGELLSPSNVPPARVIVDLRGCAKIQFDIKHNNDITETNALWARV